MSGIVGILNLDGAPVDDRLLQKLTAALTFRGPHAQAQWQKGRVGLGHTLLATTFESQHESQPCSLDGAVWITADARLDDRDRLRQQLARHQAADLSAASDAELILHAYQVWGEHCVEHLLGDFSFAIWDDRRQRLFCARDHFGLRLLYYAHVGECLLFSNTLQTLRQHPAVSNRLHEPAIGDFLLFGYNLEPDTTSFVDIRRLPPAHALIVDGSRIRCKRYWQLPVPEPLHYQRPADYVERFQELLQHAVADRLRTNRVTVWMSGGLDSTTIAALARPLLTGRGELAAMTVYYENLIPDNEREYAELTARQIGLPLHLLRGDEYPLFNDGNAPVFPEPMEEPMTALLTAQLQTSLAIGHVVLTGDGGDELLHPSGVAQMLRGLPLHQVWREVGDFVRAYRCLPPLGLGLRSKLRAWRQPSAATAEFPIWLNASFAKRCNLQQRWEQVIRAKVKPVHPWRPNAYYGLIQPLWQSVFEFYDAGVFAMPLEFRLPFLDLRLVQFALAMPPLPWFVSKEVLRRATVGLLPEKVRLRSKTSLAGEPLLEILQRRELKWLDDFIPTPLLHEYVDCRAIPRLSGRRLSCVEPYLHLRPYTLNRWLEQVHA